jgi:hypothetical protein
MVIKLSNADSGRVGWNNERTLSFDRMGDVIGVVFRYRARRC